MRLREQTYVYDDPDHPDRPTRVLEGPAYVSEDHALLFGLNLYEESLCPGRCGWPRHLAWHEDMDGWFEDHTVKCQACTAMSEDPSKPVLFHYVVDTRPADDQDLSPFVVGLTTANG